MADDWNVQIYAPASSLPGGYEQRSGDYRQHSSSGVSRRGNQVVEASVESLRASWQDTVKKLAEIGNGIDDDPSDWGVTQIEVGLTLNAKGQLLFIAEAGAEASVKITLSRRDK